MRRARLLRVRVEAMERDESLPTMASLWGVAPDHPGPPNKEE